MLCVAVFNSNGVALVALVAQHWSADGGGGGRQRTKARARTAIRGPPTHPLPLQAEAERARLELELERSARLSAEGNAAQLRCDAEHYCRLAAPAGVAGGAGAGRLAGVCVCLGRSCSCSCSCRRPSRQERGGPARSSAPLGGLRLLTGAAAALPSSRSRPPCRQQLDEARSQEEATRRDVETTMGVVRSELEAAKNSRWGGGLSWGWRGAGLAGAGQ
jgi:hypothetical protein